MTHAFDSLWRAFELILVNLTYFQINLLFSRTGSDIILISGEFLTYLLHLPFGLRTELID